MKKIIVSKLYRADDVWSRLVGLLKYRYLPEGHGLLISPCRQVHTFFMRFTIDVVFLDASYRIVRKCSLKPWRLSPYVRSAKSVLEIESGASLMLNVGEQLLLMENQFVTQTPREISIPD